MAQDLVMCESVFPDRSHTQVQTRSAVVWGVIFPVHLREAPPCSRHSLVMCQKSPTLKIWVRTFVS